MLSLSKAHCRMFVKYTRKVWCVTLLTSPFIPHKERSYSVATCGSRTRAITTCPSFTTQNLSWTCSRRRVPRPQKCFSANRFQLSTLHRPAWMSSLFWNVTMRALTSERLTMRHLAMQFGLIELWLMNLARDPKLKASIDISAVTENMYVRLW